jgi:hypothetical protein
LRGAGVSAPHREEFDRIIRFMNGAVSLDGNILRMKIEDLDWKRDQDLRTHHPELAHAIGYDGPKR